jgi:hypothetical protein
MNILGTYTITYDIYIHLLIPIYIQPHEGRKKEPKKHDSRLYFIYLFIFFFFLNLHAPIERRFDLIWSHYTMDHGRIMSCFSRFFLCSMFYDSWLSRLDLLGLGYFVHCAHSFWFIAVGGGLVMVILGV